MLTLYFNDQKLAQFCVNYPEERPWAAGQNTAMNSAKVCWFESFPSGKLMQVFIPCQ